MVKKEIKLTNENHCSDKVGESKPMLKKVQIQEELYFEDSLTEKKGIQSDQPSENIGIREKKIRKQRKPKKHNPDDRFLKEHQKKYYLFPFIYSTQNAFLKISWAQWKPNSVYKKMSKILSSCPKIPGKTSIQCKSYDQRMKFQHFIRPARDQKQDLFQSSLSYLEKTLLQPKDVQIIIAYVSKMGEKSPYMQFLTQVIEVEQIDCEQIKIECEVKRDDSSITQGTKENQILFNEFFDSA